MVIVMDKNKIIRIYCFFALSLVIGLFGAVCLFLAVSGEYNDGMGHFTVDSFFAPVVYACLVAGPLVGVAGWILFRKDKASDKALPGNIFVKAASGIAAAAILYSTVVDIMSNSGAVGFKPDGVTVISWIFSALAAASLIVSGILCGNGRVKPFVSLLAFAPALYCATEVLKLYFDQSVAVNSPVKLICQLSYLSYMLVFTAEAGLSLGRGRIYPRYIFTLCAAVAVGGCASVAALAITVADVNCIAMVGADTVAKLGLFLYSCARFASLSKIELEEEGVPETVGETEESVIEE